MPKSGLGLNNKIFKNNKIFQLFFLLLHTSSSAVGEYASADMPWTDNYKKTHIG